MIKASNIGVKFDDWIFRGIDLQINEGEIIGVIGRSGIGKTTLLKAFAGLIDLEEGDVEFKGKKLIGPAEKLIPGYEDIQLVNQDFALEPYHTVEQNIKEKILHLHTEDRDTLIKELLGLVELTAIKDRQARLLSGGEQQRLAIARALASEPEFLLLDEPFVHLDQRLRLEIVDYILELHKVRKMTIVIVSHDGAELMGVVNRVVHVDQSGIRRIAPIQEMYYLPESEGQGVLMGPINSLNINGQELLFRPNEFEIGDEVKVQYLYSIDTGMIVFNYFMVNDEKIMLSSSESMANVTGINILKRA